jgi:hypothetical protein
VKTVRYAKDKAKTGPTGQIVPTVVMDDEGSAVLDAVVVKDLVAQILNTSYQGDDQLSFADRALRGKLARKVSTSSSANYRTEELALIQELSAKAGSVILITQIDDIINGPDSQESGS